MVELQTSMFNISSHLLSFNSLFFWLFQAQRSKCKGMWPLPCRIKLAHSLSPLPLCLLQPPHLLPTACTSCYASLPLHLPPCCGPCLLHTPPHPAQVTTCAMLLCTPL